MPTGFDASVVRNVSQPTLTAFLPDSSVATGTAVIVCPGGGFHFLSMASEGLQVARWLAAHGVAAFVLKYRLIFARSAAARSECVVLVCASVPTLDKSPTMRTRVRYAAVASH
jgi:acetyl esterase/lipase